MQPKIKPPAEHQGAHTISRRGFLALAKMQAGSRPDVQAMIQSLELGGTGNTVALSFSVPSQLFDAIAAIGGQRPEKQ